MIFFPKSVDYSCLQSHLPEFSQEELICPNISALHDVPWEADLVISLHASFPHL